MLIDWLTPTRNPRVAEEPKHLFYNWVLIELQSSFTMEGVREEEYGRKK